MRGAQVSSYTPAEIISLALAAILVFLAGAIVLKWLRGSRVSPEDRERDRRAQIVRSGKIGDASLVEYRDDHIFYTYDVRGVEYTASQDVSTLKSYLPPDLSALATCPILIKYDTRNPANSVVLSEQWSGLGANVAQN